MVREPDIPPESLMEIEAVHALTNHPVRIEIAGGLIQEVSGLARPCQGLPYVAPGLVDLQVNGFLGNDYSLEDLGEEHVRRIVAALQGSGTTQHLATIVSSPHERILRNLSVVTGAIHGCPDLRDAVLGFHIEGPFISAAQGPRGAHDPAYLRDPDVRLFDEWMEAAGGLIRLVTVAPERRGAVEFIENVVERGVRVAIGHTAADRETLARAVAAGARLATHLGVGSHLMLPRLHNYVWEQLAEDRLWASIICDGFHLPAPVVKVMARVKGRDRLVLVSDAALIGGYPPGIYKWGDLSVQVHDDGHLGLAGTGFMAGAAHLLDWDVAHFLRFTGCTLAEALRLCTRNPARFLGLPESFASLDKGAPANLVLFTFQPGDERLQVLRTLRGGNTVFPAGTPVHAALPRAGRDPLAPA